MPRQRTTRKATGGGGGGGNANSFRTQILCDGVQTVFTIAHTLNSSNLSCSIAQSEDNTGVAPFYQQAIMAKIIDNSHVQYDISSWEYGAGYVYDIHLTK